MTKKQVIFAPTSTQYAFWAPSEEECEDVLMPCEESKKECGIVTQAENNECEEGESTIVTKTEDGPTHGAVLDSIIQMVQITLEKRRCNREKVVDHFKTQDTNTVLRLLAKIMRVLKRKGKYGFVKHDKCIDAKTWEPAFKFCIAALKNAQSESRS
jgi:hypothetical protein